MGSPYNPSVKDEHDAENISPMEPIFFNASTGIKTAAESLLAQPRAPDTAAILKNLGSREKFRATLQNCLCTIIDAAGEHSKLYFILFYLCRRYFDLLNPLDEEVQGSIGAFTVTEESIYVRQHASFEQQINEALKEIKSMATKLLVQREAPRADKSAILKNAQATEKFNSVLSNALVTIIGAADEHSMYFSHHRK